MRLKEITRNIVHNAAEFVVLIRETAYLNGNEEAATLRGGLNQIAVDLMNVRDDVLDDYPQWED